MLHAVFPADLHAVFSRKHPVWCALTKKYSHQAFVKPFPASVKKKETYYNPGNKIKKMKKPLWLGIIQSFVSPTCYSQPSNKCWHLLLHFIFCPLQQTTRNIVIFLFWLMWVLKCHLDKCTRPCLCFPKFAAAPLHLLMLINSPNAFGIWSPFSSHSYLLMWLWLGWQPSKQREIEKLRKQRATARRTCLEGAL